MKKIFLFLLFAVLAIHAYALNITFHLQDGNVDTVAVSDDMQLYFSDPTMQVTRLTAPVNGALNVAQRPEFSWRYVEGREVELLISGDQDFVDTLYHITHIDTNMYQLETALEVQTRYYWKVRIHGEELWTAPWYFNTYMPVRPTQLYSLALTPSGHVGSIRLKAAYESEIDSFMAVIGLNGQDFPDTCYVDTAGMEISGLDPDSCYFMKIAGMNGAGTGPLSEVLAASVSTVENPVLIINAFDRSTTGNSHDFIRQHADAVLDCGYTLVSATNDAITDGLLSFPFYSSVIYILGEESTADETFSNAEQDVIETYLKAGGHMFVSGAEIAWDLGYKGSTTDKAFMKDYLHLDYKQDAPNGVSGTYYNVKATGDTIFANLDPFAFDNGTHGTYNVRYPDVFTPMNGAKTFLTYTGCTAGAAGIVFQGAFSGSDKEGKIMVLGFPFETVYPEAARTAIMSEFFEFSEYGLDVEDNVMIPEDTRLLPNYPNPFNPVTRISYQLSDIGRVELNVIDLNGRRVARLFNGEKPAGYYSMTWNASSVASGVYISVLKVDDKIIDSRKMLLVK